MTYEEYAIHPLADKFPLMRGAAFDDFAVSIEQRGLLEPIVMLDGVVIDGRNRLRACLQSGVEPTFTDYKHSIPVEEYIWIVNVDRRHLTDDQRAAAALAFEEFEKEQAKARMEAGKKADPPLKPAEGVGDTRDALAKRAEVSRYKIEQAQKIKRHDEEHGTDHLEQVKAGDLTLKDAAKEAGITNKSAVAVAKPQDTKRPERKGGVRRSRQIDVNRIVGHTALYASSFGTGLEEIDDRLDELDQSQIEVWIKQIDEGIEALTKFSTKLVSRRGVA